jgi:hypothetical protein
MAVKCERASASSLFPSCPWPAIMPAAVVTYSLATLVQMTNDEAATTRGGSVQKYDPRCRSLCAVRSRIQDKIVRTLP